MAKVRSTLKSFDKIKINVVFDGLAVGLSAGFVSTFYRFMLTAFDKLRDTVTAQRDIPVMLGWALLLIVLAYLVSVLLKWAPLSGGSGIPQVQGEMLGLLNMDPLRVLISKFLGGGMVGLAGLSLGREGPSIQIGAAVGKLVSRLLGRNHTEEKYIISAGAGAGLSAAFNAPISGTIFVLEEMHKTFNPLILVPSLIAAVVADFISKRVFGLQPVFSMTAQNALPLENYSMVIVLAVLVGLLGVLFNTGLLAGQKLYSKSGLPKNLHPFIPFILSIILVFTFRDILGGGHALIEGLVKGNSSLTFLLLLLIAKLLFTIISFDSGVQGGIFLPILVMGGILGLACYKGFLGLGLLEAQYLDNFIILAMAAMLSSVVRSPILSIVLVTEMTGSFSHILSLCLVSIVAYLVAELCHCRPVYESLLERILRHEVNLNESSLREKVIELFLVPVDSPLIDMSLKEIGIPVGCLVLSVERNGEELIPNGDTTLKSGDQLTLLVSDAVLTAAKKALFWS